MPAVLSNREPTFSIPRYALPQGKQHYLKLKVLWFVKSTISQSEFTFSAAASSGICCQEWVLVGYRSVRTAYTRVGILILATLL